MMLLVVAAFPANHAHRPSQLVLPVLLRLSMLMVSPLVRTYTQAVQLFGGQGAGLAASAPISRGEIVLSVRDFAVIQTLTAVVTSGTTALP